MKEKNSTLTLAIGMLLLSVNVLWAQSIPQKGDLLITEFMVNPVAVSDTKGEWVELCNTSNKTLIMNGLKISDSGSNNHTIGSDPEILLPAGQFFILSRSLDQTENGGLEANYAYSNFTLGNTEDEIILSLPDGTVLDAVAYDGDWPVLSGCSLELDRAWVHPDQNDQPNKWHPATDPYGDGDLGTPGRINSISTGLFNQGIINYFEVFPNPTQGQLFIRISSKTNQPLSMKLITLLGQSIPIIEQSLNQELVIPLDLSGWDGGFYWIEATIGTEKYVQKVLIQSH